MRAVRLNWQNIRQYIWLIGGLLCLLVALIFWVMTDTKSLVTTENPIEDSQVQIQSEKVTATTHLGSLTDEVRPLEQTTRMVASGNHGVEFRGTKFIQENKKNWTLELFRTTDEDIIKSFLLKQVDRKNFIYFRLSGENQAEQYVLAYGVFKSGVEAKTQLTQLRLGLPASVHPKAIQIDQYVPLVNDLGADEMQGGSNKLYEVKLKSAPLPIIDETLLPKPVVASPTTSAMETATKTTITRKDQKGQVVDVQRSQSTVNQWQAEQPKAKENGSAEKKPVQHEISDPFN